MAPWAPFDQALSARPAHRPPPQRPDLRSPRPTEETRGALFSGALLLTSSNVPVLTIQQTSEEGTSHAVRQKLPPLRGCVSKPRSDSAADHMDGDAQYRVNRAELRVRRRPYYSRLRLAKFYGHRAPPPPARLTGSSKSATYNRPRTGTRARVRGKHAVVFALSATTRMMPTDHPG